MKTCPEGVVFLFFNMGGTASHPRRGSEMKGAEEKETLEEQSPRETRGEVGAGGRRVPGERSAGSLVIRRKPEDTAWSLRW